MVKNEPTATRESDMAGTLGGGFEASAVDIYSVPGRRAGNYPTRFTKRLHEKRRGLTSGVAHGRPRAEQSDWGVWALVGFGLIMLAVLERLL